MTTVITNIEKNKHINITNKIQKLIVKCQTKNRLHFSKLMIYVLWLNHKNIINTTIKRVNRQWFELQFEVNFKFSNKFKINQQIINQLTNKKNMYIKKSKNTYICRKITNNMSKQPLIDYQMFKICTQTLIIYEN